jgi:hypothetical protein
VEVKIVAHVNVVHRSSTKRSTTFPASLSPPSSSLFFPLLDSGAHHCISLLLCFFSFPFPYSSTVAFPQAQVLNACVTCPDPTTAPPSTPPLRHMAPLWPPHHHATPLWPHRHHDARPHCHITPTCGSIAPMSPRCACHLISSNTYPHAAPTPHSQPAIQALPNTSTPTTLRNHQCATTEPHTSATNTNTPLPHHSAPPPLPPPTPCHATW